MDRKAKAQRKTMPSEHAIRWTKVIKSNGYPTTARVLLLLVGKKLRISVTLSIVQGNKELRQDICRPNSWNGQRKTSGRTDAESATDAAACLAATAGFENFRQDGNFKEATETIREDVEMLTKFPKHRKLKDELEAPRR